MEELAIDQDQFNNSIKTQLKSSVKLNRSKKRSDHFKNKVMHGEYFRILDEPHIDKKASLSWMNSSALK